MKHQMTYAFKKCGVLLSILLVTLTIVGCEGGKEETSAPVTQGQPGQGLPEFQPDIGGPESQIEMLKARLFDEPENAQLLSALGDLYFEARRFQEAIPMYEKAVSINPNDYDALNDLGLAHFYTRNEMAALEALDKSIAANPDYKYALLSKGFILVSIGRFNDAEVPLQKVKELDPGGKISVEADKFLKKIEEYRATQPGG